MLKHIHAFVLSMSLVLNHYLLANIVPPLPHAQTCEENNKNLAALLTFKHDSYSKKDLQKILDLSAKISLTSLASTYLPKLLKIKQTRMDENYATAGIYTAHICTLIIDLLENALEENSPLAADFTKIILFCDRILEDQSNNKMVSKEIDEGLIWLLTKLSNRVILPLSKTLLPEKSNETERRQLRAIAQTFANIFADWFFKSNSNLSIEEIIIGIYLPNVIREVCAQYIIDHAREK